MEKKPFIRPECINCIQRKNEICNMFESFGCEGLDYVEELMFDDRI